MSSHPKKRKRVEHDFYETPAWTTEAILRKLGLKPGRWLEPCAGNGAIIKQVNKHYGTYAPGWTICELQEKFRDPLEPYAPPGQIHCPQDFLSWDRHFDYDVSMTNPPYLLAEAMIAKQIGIAEVVVNLLRLNFLGSAKRVPFFRVHKPDIYVLGGERPSFDGNGTDSTEYAWFVWGLTSGGHWEHLDLPKMYK